MQQDSGLRAQLQCVAVAQVVFDHLRKIPGGPLMPPPVQGLGLGLERFEPVESFWSMLSHDSSKTSKGRAPIVVIEAFT